MARKKKCPECPPKGAPGWMNTFADMSTLLLTFFVLLLSMSTIEQQKFTVAMSSLKGALGVLSAQGVAIPITRMPLVQIGTSRAEQEIERQVNDVREMIRRTETTEDMKIHQTSDFLHFTISQDFLFDSGQAEVKEVGIPILEAIARILNTVPFNIRIEGHTDSVPISTVRFPSNWELSFSRALAVSKVFGTQGVNPARFQVIGHGEFLPVADNSTPEGRGINRRVEVYVSLKEDVRRSLLPE